MKQKLLIGGVLLAAGIGAAMFHTLSSGEPTATAEATTAPPIVPVANVELPILAPLGVFTGFLEPAQQVDLRARVSGALVSANIPEGADVETGDILFVIDADRFEARAAAARAALARARSLLEQAEGDFSRAEALRPSGAISQKAFEDALALLDRFSSPLNRRGIPKAEVF